MTPVGIPENSLDLLGILGPGPPVRSTFQCIIPSNQRHRLRRISPFEFSEYHSTVLYSYDSCFLPMSKYHFFLDYQKTERVPKIKLGYTFKRINNHTYDEEYTALSGLRTLVLIVLISKKTFSVDQILNFYLFCVKNIYLRAQGVLKKVKMFH